MARKHPKQTPRPGVDEYGRTPLHHAADKGDWRAAEQLLPDGADPALPDDDGWTPLHFAVQAYSAQVVRVLVSAGAPVDPPDEHGNTPLWRAVMESRGRGELITVLRAAGANPYTANVHGISPIALAYGIANFDARQFFADCPPPRPGP